MSDHFTAEIDALMARIEAAAVHEKASRLRTRLVVATDWSSAAVPFTVLRAFVAIVPPNAPIELVFATPHDPTADDARCIHVLLEGVGVTEELPSWLEVASFEEVVSAPYDSALIPNGDSDQLIAEVGGLITRMHDLVRRHDHGEEPLQAGAGSTEAMRLRLASFQP